MVVAAISASGSIIVGVAALVLAYRGLNSIERRLMERELKEFYRWRQAV